MAMRTRFKVLAVVAAVLGADASSAAMAKYPCAPGYRYHNRVCQPVRHLGYGNPVSGAVSGEAAGAARGAATGCPDAAVVGGALGTARGALTGTAHLLSTARQAARRGRRRRADKRKRDPQITTARHLTAGTLSLPGRTCRRCAPGSVRRKCRPSSRRRRRGHGG